MTGSYFFALGVVALVMGGGFALLRFAHGRGLIPARANPIRVVAQHSLGMGASVVLVEVEGARVLLGVSKAGVSGLSWAPNPSRHAELVSPLVTSVPASIPQPKPESTSRAEPWTLKQVQGDDAFGYGANVQRPASFSAVLKRAGAR